MVHVIDFVTVPISPVEKVVLTDTVNGPVGARYGTVSPSSQLRSPPGYQPACTAARHFDGPSLGRSPLRQAAIGRPWDGDGCR
jgi:hypothetical protein